MPGSPARGPGSQGMWLPTTSTVLEIRCTAAAPTASVVADTDVTVRRARSSRSPPFWVAAASLATVPPWLLSSGSPAACRARYLRVIASRAAVRVVVPSGSTSMRLPVTIRDP